MGKNITGKKIISPPPGEGGREEGNGRGSPPVAHCHLNKVPLWNKRWTQRRGGPPRGPPLASSGAGSRKRQKTQFEPTLKIQFQLPERKNSFESFLKTKFEKINRNFKANFQKKTKNKKKAVFKVLKTRTKILSVKNFYSSGKMTKFDFLSKIAKYKSKFNFQTYKFEILDP